MPISNIPKIENAFHPGNNLFGYNLLVQADHCITLRIRDLFSTFILVVPLIFDFSLQISYVFKYTILLSFYLVYFV